MALKALLFIAATAMALAGAGKFFATWQKQRHMQDKFIVNKIDELKFEVAKSQSLDSLQQTFIEGLLARCAEAASCDKLHAQICNN